ncbi:type 1 periplasmic binding fold superfamily protein [uncultured Algibacter sp.]|uniref:type 1 periplasmic binding fold superfamily protein n=1 Tax=uncultured Algibacter sp. TaxID=298659 RepID=UPI00263592A1|nr:type 1 periplasmic binding fold superfamily protein [uncultured Algibacter sp.]
MKTTKFFLGVFFCLTLITSCSDDDTPPPVLEEELITNVTLTFTNDADATDVVVMGSVAPDGQDGASTEVITGSFTANATYSLNLAITNASETPPEDVLNDDIIPEGDEHFFVYAVNGINLTMSRDSDDEDGADGNKLGVKTTWVAGAAGTGNVQITLVHEPEGADDSDEWGSVTGGSEDLNITFTGAEIQ